MIEVGEKSKIVITKPSENTLKVVVYLYNPLKQEHNVVYQGFYVWNPTFHSLISTECKEYEAPYEPPTVNTQCKDAIKIASKIMDIVLSGDVKDVEESGYNAMAHCLETKTVTVTSQEFRTCFNQVIGDVELAKATLRQKI